MSDFYCHGCGKRRSVAVLAPERVKDGKGGMTRKQCVGCRDKRIAPSKPDDVVGKFPDGRPMLRKHVLERNHRRAQKHYLDGSAFKGWS